MEFNKARKQLNRELKWVARGESPTRALSCLHQMFSMTLAECTDDAEILGWTIKMISRCAERQATILSPNLVQIWRNKKMNEVVLIGTIDGEIKEFQGQKSVKASFRLVTARSFNGQEFKDWHNVVLWGDKAQAAAGKLTAGDVIMVRGRIGTRKYTKQDGTDAYITEITAYGVYKEVVGTNTNRDETKADYAKFGEEIPF